MRSFVDASNIYILGILDAFFNDVKRTSILFAGSGNGNAGMGGGVAGGKGCKRCCRLSVCVLDAFFQAAGSQPSLTAENIPSYLGTLNSRCQLVGGFDVCDGLCRTLARGVLHWQSILQLTHLLKDLPDLVDVVGLEGKSSPWPLLSPKPACPSDLPTSSIHGSSVDRINQSKESSFSTDTLALALRKHSNVTANRSFSG